jgi:hypothetical protein
MPKKWASRCADPDEVHAVAKPYWQKLTYLVFDGQKLVATFAMREDAQHWIEECGNRAMKLREMSGPNPHWPPKRKRADKSSGKAAGMISRKR